MFCSSKNFFFEDFCLHTIFFFKFSFKESSLLRILLVKEYAELGEESRVTKVFAGTSVIQSITTLKR